MVEDASGDVAAVDARDVNTQLQVEMIEQQLKTNAFLRARTRTVSASGTHPHSTRAAVAASRTLRWQPSEERDPADHRAQPAEGKYEEPGFSDAVPTRLSKCGGLHSNWYWNPCT